MGRIAGVCMVLMVLGCGGGGSNGNRDAAGGAGGAAGGGGDVAGQSGTAGSGGATSTGSGGGDAAAGAGPGSGGAAGAGGDAATDTPVDGGAVVDGDGAIDPGDAAGDTPSTDVATNTIDARDGGEAGDDAAPKLVTVAFTGKVETVAPAPDGGMPLGFDTTVRLSSVSGSFAYDLGLADQEPSDPLRGKYQSAGAAAFSFTLNGHTVTGSGKALIETENLDPDTFRFLD